MWKTFAKLNIMTVEERRRRRFTTEFHKEQVALIESGEVTISEVARMYQVKSDNVRRWVKKYGNSPLPEPIIIQSRKDYNRLSELEKENKRLKEMLGDQYVKIIFQDKLLEIAKEKLGDDFEKKV